MRNLDVRNSRMSSSLNFDSKSHPHRWLCKDDKARSYNMKLPRSLLVVQKMQTLLLRLKRSGGSRSRLRLFNGGRIIVAIEVSLRRALR